MKRLWLTHFAGIFRPPLNFLVVGWFRLHFRAEFLGWLGKGQICLKDDDLVLNFPMD